MTGEELERAQEELKARMLGQSQPEPRARPAERYQNQVAWTPRQKKYRKLKSTDREMEPKEAPEHLVKSKVLSPERNRFVKVDGLGQQIALVPGGIRQFIKWVRAACVRTPSFSPVLEAYERMPESRQNANELEGICQTLGVPVGDLLGAAVTIAYEWKRDEARLIASLAIPEVVKANIRRAKEEDGVEDRRMFMQAQGILPTPKGSVINVSSSSSSMTMNGDPSGVPSFDDATVSFSEVIRNAVEPPRGLPEPVDAVLVKEE